MTKQKKDGSDGLGELQRGPWVLAYNVLQLAYFAFRVKSLEDLAQPRLSVKSFTHFDISLKEMASEKKDDKPRRAWFMVPKKMTVCAFDQLLTVETECVIDMTGNLWWHLEDLATIDEILKAWLPERMTPAEKAELEAKRKQAAEASEPSRIITPDNMPAGGMPVSPALRQKVANNLLKLAKRPR